MAAQYDALGFFLSQQRKGVEGYGLMKGERRVVNRIR
jgi:hypothetical protein